jgi:iron complex outermembrane recepter protein
MAAFNRNYRLGTSLAAIALAACAVPALAQSSDDNAPEADIIVTGVFGAKAIEDAPISVSAVTAEELAQQIPNSAADLIKNVPGVYVNSSLGEIRNVVFSRGVSANSLDGDGGYYYVSLQEDGLPIEPVLVSNFGPDYFARPDIMLNRLEGLRGGTATVTGANAPGGIFNYISRNGRSNPGFEFQGKFGLEGDGRNPYYRIDGYAGGALSDSLYYAIGGFYRKSDGARDPGYAMNKGGQVRANLLWDYGAGSLTVDAKYLNDHNGWFEFIPARNFSSPKLEAPFNTYSSVLPPRNPHSFTNPDGSTGSWDAADLVHSKALSFGMSWDHELSDTIKLQNKMRWTENKSNWSTGAVIFALPLDDFFVSLLSGTFGIPGVTSYRFSGTNDLAAQVTSFSGFDHTVTTNNLPNQTVQANGVFSQVALSQAYKSRTFQDQFTATGEFGNHDVAVGAFYSRSRLRQNGGAAGLGFSPLQSRPQLFDITHTLPDGTVLQVTDPTGFSAQGGGLFDGDGYGGTQKQLSFFLADNWEINDALSVDAAVRYEDIRYRIFNLTLGPAAPVNGGGGADNNPLTLWDNNLNTYGATTRTNRKFTYWNYTGSVNYKFTDSFQAYVRFTNGKKAPDFRTIVDIDSPEEIANSFPKPQVIKQFEVGLKYRRDGVRIAVFPFYSKLSNVGTTQIFVNQSGQFYTPPAVFGQIKTYGVEIDADADFGDMFSVRTALTLQNPKASKFGAWVHDSVTNDPLDDVLVPTPKGDADNNPKILSRTTATLKPVAALELFLTHNYTGKRAANRENAWYLPGFHTFDFGASYEFGERFKLQANVNNVFNQFGVLSWARSGGFLASLDRQGLTKDALQDDPNQLFSVVPTQPRSFWVTATVKF